MIADTVALSALLHVCNIFIHSCTLLGSGQFIYQFALRSQYHECHTEDCVGTSGEDSEMLVAVLNRELHLCTF